MRLWHMLPVLGLLSCGYEPLTHDYADASVPDATSVSAGAPTTETSTVFAVREIDPVFGRRRILIVGDSEACAIVPYAWSVSHTHPTIVEDDLLEVACKDGTTVKYWGEQGHLADYWTRHPSPDAVIVFLGTNHVWNGTDTPDVLPILNQIRERGIDCVWVGNTAVNGKHWNVNNLLHEAVTPTCTYFDTEAADIPLRDGIHPTQAGAIKWLKAIWPMIPQKQEKNDE